MDGKHNPIAKKIKISKNFIYQPKKTIQTTINPQKHF